MFLYYYSPNRLAAKGFLLWTQQWAASYQRCLPSLGSCGILWVLGSYGFLQVLLVPMDSTLVLQTGPVPPVIGFLWFALISCMVPYGFLCSPANWPGASRHWPPMGSYWLLWVPMVWEPQSVDMGFLLACYAFLLDCYQVPTGFLLGFNHLFGVFAGIICISI